MTSASVETIVALASIGSIALVAIVCLVMGRRILVKLGRVEVQVTPNGGETNRLGDMVIRLDKRLTRLEHRLDGVDGAGTSDAATS